MPGRLRVTAGDQHRASRGANWAIGDGLIKHQSFPRQPVNIWGIDLVLAVDWERERAQLVWKQNNDVRAILTVLGA